ncbi:MAG: TIGR01777 family protein [Planctomycetes bacterium]|nr:TIGR01777 family protein [Planctomycetota bacterium]
MSEHHFQRSVDLPVSSQEAYDWHARPGAFERLLPPWQGLRVERAPRVEEGFEAVFRVRIGPFWRRWIARHTQVSAGASFCDQQVRGPFAAWTHRHLFESLAPRLARLTDSIHYRLPFGPLGDRLGRSMVRRDLERTFRYRHDALKEDLVLYDTHRDQGTLRIAVTGASGLVGRALTSMLGSFGHDVVRLVRGESRGESEVLWDPERGLVDPRALGRVDAVVHLAGEGIASGRWNRARKRAIEHSRVQGTKALVESLKGLAEPPKVFVCASAIGFYGSRGERPLDESSDPGEGFLAEVAKRWEHEAWKARELGCRVVCTRFGVILSPRGGALAKMLLPFKLGAGGRIGSGRQFMSWISLDDTISALYHVVMNPSVDGPVNVVAPRPVTNREYTKTLGKVLSRPTLFPMPAFAARLAFGEMADELLLSSTRVEPKVLTNSGFKFRHESLEAALRHVLGKEPADAPS